MKSRNAAILILLLYFGIYFLSYASYLYEEGELSNPFDYARITDVDYKAVVVDEPNSHGKVIITEKITFDIHAASKSNPFWELWRDLPEDTIDGLNVRYKVNSVKQILDDGTKIVYEESPKLYWDDSDYLSTSIQYGPGKWYHSEGPYSEYGRQYECVFFYVDGLYREKVTFEIEYEMYNAALKYNDCSELYLCMYSEETIKYLESFNGQILFKNKDMPREGNYDINTYGTNSNSFIVTESEVENSGYHTFSISLDKSDLKFRPYNQYIEFSLLSHGEDKHIFTEYAPDNHYSHEDVLSEYRQEQEEYDSLSGKYLRIKFLVFLICFLLTVFLLKKLLKADDEIEAKYNFYEPTMLQMDYFREIPSNLDPSFAAALVFCKDSYPKDVKDNYAAILLSLVRKEYIELARINEQKDWDFYNVKIVIKNNQPKQISLHPELYLVQSAFNELYENDSIKSLEPLTPTEEAYYNLIIRHAKGANEIPMRSFQSKVSIDYENTDSFVRNIENSTVNIGISQGYFQKANYKEPRQKLKSQSTFYGIIGLILLIGFNYFSYQTRLDFALGGFTILGISFLFGSILLRGLSQKYILLTQFGEDEYIKWRGLYNFLNSETLMNERTVIELPLWEQYLVYATAFGISDKVIKAINIRCPDMDTSSMLNNSYYRSRSFYSSSRSFRNTARSTSYSARSGGYGGYGGYGGGGRGGGGGGGGH